MQLDNITAIHSNDQLQLQSGIIDSMTESVYRISTPRGHVVAIRAFSCVVEPNVDDIVLFSTDTRMQGHILSILERPGNQATQLGFPADVTLKTNGQMHLNAAQDINLSTQENIALLSEEVSVSAQRGIFNIDRLSAVGSTLVAKINNLQTYAHSLETVADHWLQKLKNSFRRVEGVDQLKTRDSLHTVDNLYSMRTKQAAILAKKDIKMDAERIHMG